MAHVLLLGAGKMGRLLAEDLASLHTVTVVDREAAALAALQEKGLAVQGVQAEGTDLERLAPYLAKADLVVIALPGRVAFSVLSQLVTWGKILVDISFFPEDPFLLEQEALRHGAVVAVDCGLAPGLSHAFLGRALSVMQEVTSFTCWVGGLPYERSWPWQYKAPFSVSDVLEEYLRPVRQRLNGQLVIKPPLSEVELVEVPGIGTLEAFNTDGLRTLLSTTRVPTLREKTLRYPGHAEAVAWLVRSGFLSEEPLEVEGQRLSPRAFTEAVLSRVWHLGPQDRDWVFMRVEITGYEAGRLVQRLYTLRVEALEGHSAMARATAYPAAAVVNWLLRENLPPGILPPEILAQHPRAWAFLTDYLSQRGVVWQEETRYL
ncbi:MAG: saccharopine reductase [Bacteroidia bacterium]|nr:MAG: saccharopine reductase [Bacteroidia bacterium]